jgi:hypothetical protein
VRCFSSPIDDAARAVLDSPQRSSRTPYVRSDRWVPTAHRRGRRRKYLPRDGCRSHAKDGYAPEIRHQHVGTRRRSHVLVTRRRSLSMAYVRSTATVSANAASSPPGHSAVQCRARRRARRRTGASGGHKSPTAPGWAVLDDHLDLLEPCGIEPRGEIRIALVQTPADPREVPLRRLRHTLAREIAERQDAARRERTKSSPKRSPDHGTATTNAIVCDIPGSAHAALSSRSARGPPTGLERSGILLGWLLRSISMVGPSTSSS